MSGFSVLTKVFGFVRSPVSWHTVCLRRQPKNSVNPRAFLSAGGFFLALFFKGEGDYSCK